MPHNVLLLGRTGIVLKNVEDSLDVDDVKLFAGTSLEDVIEVMADHSIVHVIMGAGIDIDTRLSIIKHIFETSTSTSVHMKDWDSGPTGMLPFVNGVLSGLSAQQ